MNDRVFNSERELVDLVLAYLASMRFSAAAEVPSMGQSVDIAAKRGERLFLFETKLNDWRKALRQAERHLIVADYVLVILPAKQFSGEFFVLAGKLGIGVVVVEPSGRVARVALRPRESDCIWLPQRKQFERQLEELLDVN